MISGIRILSCSGAMGGSLAAIAVPNLEIFNLGPSASSDPNRLGFFGSAGAPSSPVRVGQYQDRSHVTNQAGDDLGALINVKFTGTSAAEVSGVSIAVTGHTLATIPQSSGTILLRFTEPNGIAVQTQNGVFRCVGLDADNFTITGGVGLTANAATGITVQAAQLGDNSGNAGNVAWTELTAAPLSSLSLSDQALSASVHDFHLIISANPSAAGTKINFGFYTEIEFL